MVPATKPASATAITAYRSRDAGGEERHQRDAPAWPPGSMNCRRRLAAEAFRQAISGPMPVSPSSRRPSGTFTRLKNGGPTVILVPRTASDRIGNSVPHRTENAIPTSSRLLNRNAASRLSIDSSWTSASSSGHRV